MKIKILGKNNKKNFLKENCGVPAEPDGVEDISSMTPEVAFDAGYSAAVEEMMEIIAEMMPGGDPIEAEVDIPVAIANVDQLEEKWKGDVEIEQTGEWAGKTLDQLRKRKNTLMDKEERTPEEQEGVREINFAIRAKTGWKKGKGATK